MIKWTRTSRLSIKFSLSLIEQVRTHKQKLLLKPSLMALPDGPASGPDVWKASLKDDVWSLIVEDLTPITDIENAVKASNTVTGTPKTLKHLTSSLTLKPDPKPEILPRCGSR